MAGIFGSTIVAFCMSAVSGGYNDACTHALDAGTQQIGVRQQVDNVEDKSTKIVGQYATKTFGKESISVIAAGGYVYRFTREKSINFRLPTLGLCSSINNQVASDSYRLILEWKL